MIAFCMVTAVPTRRRPLTVAPVLRPAEVAPNRTHWKSDSEPRVTLPETTQTMFLGTAPPVRTTEAPSARVSVWLIWNIQASETRLVSELNRKFELIKFTVG